MAIELETPFTEYKATELTQEKINQYFVEPKYISKMYTNTVSFVVGQRGTGKTTLLKYLCANYNKKDDMNKKERLGVYYRFDINKMHSFSGSALSEEEWSTLFSHCFSIEICKTLTRLLIELKDCFPLHNEENLCRHIRNMFFDEIDIEVYSLESLLNYLERIEYIAMKYKRNPLSAPRPMISECEKAYEEFCFLVNQDPAFYGVCVHFLFDEYENMLDYQQEFINSCIKNASYYLTYKICVRPYGNENLKTRKPTEVLQEADDFKTLDYLSDIIGDSDDIAKFMRSACRRRLQDYYQSKQIIYTENDLDIEEYFPSPKSDDALFAELASDQAYFSDVQQQVSHIFFQHNRDFDYTWSLLQMKLFLVLFEKRGFQIDAVIDSFQKKDKKYTNWLNNYKKAILFQCFSEQNKRYEMAGFDNIVSISGDIVRYVLEICDYSFLCTNYSSDGKYSKINEKMQTYATYKVSERRFQQISTISDMGQEIKQMVLAIGTIFNMYHRDPQVKRFEPNHFSIERNNPNGSYNESRVKDAIRQSVMNGVLIAERSTKNRSGSDVPIEDEDFHLHPILTPYFQISWRKKQKCRFTFDEIDTFLFGSDQKISSLLEQYSKKTTNEHDNAQISFSDLKKQSYFDW